MLSFFKISAGVLLGKTLALALKIRGKRGTALPGLIVEKFLPDFLVLARQYLGKVIVITGTNGKTTTQTVLSKLLEQVTSENVIVNSRGANLSRGLISELCKRFDFGKLIRGEAQASYTVFEIEEATFPKVASAISADIVILTNFFRDQLDAYGEVERTKTHVLNALKLCPKAKIIINNDDPQTLELISRNNLAAHSVSIGNWAKSINYEPANINNPFISKGILIAEDIVVNPDFSTKFTLANLGEINLKLPGIHSIYAVLFSLLALSILLEMNLAELDVEKIKLLLKSLGVPFGRGEKINIAGNSLQIFLIKNPAGFNATLDMLKSANQDLNLIILINDNIADGKDVSWLWDADLDKLNEVKLDSNVIVGGTRGLDMKLRLEYTSKNLLKIIYKNNLGDIARHLGTNENGKNYTILATYTAMNQLRDLVTKD